MIDLQNRQICPTLEEIGAYIQKSLIPETVLPTPYRLQL